jgi:hypothetical protein
MDRPTREPTWNEAVERRAAFLIAVETVVLIFAGLPAGLFFLVGAAGWRIGLYAFGLGLGLMSLGSAVFVFRPGTTAHRKPTLLFWAFALLLGALVVAAVWVFASVVSNDILLD